MRVHELAKELDKPNKDIMQILSDNKIEVKSHMSTLTEDDVKLVKNYYHKQTTAGKEEPAGKMEEKKETKEVKKTTETGAAAPARPEGQVVRKKKYVSVYNPQNSRTNLKPPMGVRNGASNRPAGAAAARPAAAPAAKSETVKAEAPKAETPAAKPAAAKTEAPKAAVTPAAEVPAKTEGAARTESPKTDRPAGSRQEGDRPYGNRQNGDRPYGNRQGGDRPYGNRQNGDRPYGNRQNGDRPYGNRQGGDRPYGNRQGGDRPYGNRQEGDRPYGNRQNGDRPYGNRQGGDRPYGNRQDGDRPYGNRQGGERSFGGNRQGGDRNFGGNRQGGGSFGGNRQGGQGGFQGRSGGRGGNNDDRAALDRAALDHANAERANSEKRAYKEKANRERQNRERKEQERDNLTNLKNKPKKNGFQMPKPVEKKEDEIRTVTLPETLTIKELADALKVQPAAIVKKLFLQGVMATVNQEITYEKAEEIALEYNCIAEPEEKVDVIEELLREDEEDEKDMVPRPPVVCVMGHVDHGKTSLLDAIRHTNVISGEAGGITQHIGASVIKYNGQRITFLDTPGHEAFTAMRMRGANSTDIAILVVAADDGVMPQTIEAISHAKAAGIEIIVAINKIDKPSANVDRVKQELSEYELIPEDWGGSTIFVPVSAKTGEGIDTLLEMLLLTAEMHELKANPKREARGLVIEAELDKGKGPVATVLVQKGTLHVGDPIAAGACHGKVRAMMDDKGRRVKEAGPSTPVEILGLSDVPNAGEIFVSLKTEKEARSFAETFISQGREKLLEDTKSRMSLDDLFSQIQAGNVKELNIIVKADVQGSVEAIKQSLVKLSNEEVVVKIIHGGVGAINESDVSLASASNAIIIGFNVRPDATAKNIAEQEGVDLRLYRVIYNAIEDVEAAMKGMLDPVFEEKVIGHAEVRQLFKASGVGTIAGSYVLDGSFQRGCKVRITREGEQIYEGELASLKRFKDDVKEVKAGYECGLVFEKFNDLQELDQVEAYIMVEVPR
ncbi:translation initiation factor IF-2 [Oscillospiraceae bacterium Marseille-Q3528]|nr:translation initiation factor IF-2 [Oscillospiraceae bacterium Marseille-Q3528]WNV59583.1 translation initiation factor IF-2 [Oscillospiraceae bacterium NTUH-002-81]